jgi:membrane protein insertase Oxa1/YidC/SpoIIIJ
MQIAAILIGLAYSIISLAITRKLTKKEKLSEIQKRIKELNGKELTEKERLELIQLFNKSLLIQMRPAFVIMPIFFFIYFIIPKELQFDFVLASIIFGIILNILSEIKFGEKNEKE